MRLGILETVGLAGSLVFALPVALYAGERLLAGETVLGLSLLAVAALMVYLPRRLTTPGDLPGEAAERVVGDAVLDGDDEDDQ